MMNKEMIGGWEALVQTNDYFIATKGDYTTLVALVEGETGLFNDDGIKHILFHKTEGSLLYRWVQSDPNIDYTKDYDLVLTSERVENCLYESDEIIHS